MREAYNMLTTLFAASKFQ